MLGTLKGVLTTRLDLQKRLAEVQKEFFGEGNGPIYAENLSEVRRSEFDHQIDLFIHQTRQLDESRQFSIFVAEYFVRYGVMRFDDLLEEIRAREFDSQVPPQPLRQEAAPSSFDPRTMVPIIPPKDYLS